jgi:hypothetical protein
MTPIDMNSYIKYKGLENLRKLIEERFPIRFMKSCLLSPIALMQIKISSDIKSAKYFGADGVSAFGYSELMLRKPSNEYVICLN